MSRQFSELLSQCRELESTVPGLVFDQSQWVIDHYGDYSAGQMRMLPNNTFERTGDHPRPPRLSLAPSAHEALTRYMAQITEFRPVVALTWTVGASVGVPGKEGFRELEPHWGVGFYDASDVPLQLIVVEMQGIPFAFGFASDPLLDGKRLHCSEGRFDVEDETNGQGA